MSEEKKEKKNFLEKPTSRREFLKKTGLLGMALAGSGLVGRSGELTGEDQHREIWHMKKGDGTTFPVTFEASHDNFPAVVVNSLADREQNVHLHLIALHDMTDILEHRQQTAGEGSSQVAADVITEMVHVVRNPLTAIKGAGQLLDAAVDDMFRNTGQMTEEDWQSIKAMCRIIYDQTQHLDEKVRELLSCAATHPDRVLERFPEAGKWRLRISDSGGKQDAVDPSGG